MQRLDSKSNNWAAGPVVHDLDSNFVFPHNEPDSISHAGRLPPTPPNTTLFDMKMLPPSLMSLVLAAIPALSYASPQPALVSDEFMHLMPRNTLFFRQTSDLQTFTQSLGGFKASPITNSGDTKRPFSVDGDTFTDFQSAAQRSCDNQFQQCSQQANSQGGDKGAFSVSECDKQKSMLKWR